MGFFQKLKNGLARFMYGRNGTDQLGIAMLWAYVGLIVARMVFAMLELGAAALVCDVLTYAAAILILFRMMSRNLSKRREENARWLQSWWKVKNRRRDAKARRADKEHKYFTCKSCKAVCRVPAGKGKVVITCPKCGKQLQAKT